ncbi:glycoside hydrolase family 55 protein [Mycena amicta]|nr:glycoside hydrolase family 55 protein [Mycena amicta]
MSCLSPRCEDEACGLAQRSQDEHLVCPSLAWLHPATYSGSRPLRHQGKSAYNPDPAYQVFRNVEDFGAKGDGITDDTKAYKVPRQPPWILLIFGNTATLFLLEIDAPGTLPRSCKFYSSPGSVKTYLRITPAVVYFPQGTYLVSEPIIAYYYTQLIGDPKSPPTLLATSSFKGMAVIGKVNPSQANIQSSVDANPYLSGGKQWYINQNNFFRSMFVYNISPHQLYNAAFAEGTLSSTLDGPSFSVSLAYAQHPHIAFRPTTIGTGIHWQIGQSTSLMNIQFYMSDALNSTHQGIFMENGSGGFMGDLVFNGGKFGMWVGNQQFTVRNVTINNAQIAIQGVWAWGWTWQGVTIRNCSIGFDLLGGVGAEAIIDAKVYDTPIFVRSASPSNGVLVGSLVLNNIHLHNVPTAVGVVGGAIVLSGGADLLIDSWVQGNVYAGNRSSGTFTQGHISGVAKPPAVLNSEGEIFGKMHPQYEHYHVDQFVSVRDHGATGDGISDDSAALQAVLNKYASSKIIFFDAGTYIVKSTLTIPAGSRIVGEAWSVISGAGPAFQDAENPQVVVRVGQPGSVGVVEITDLVFSTVGPAPGAIVVEWEIQECEQGSAGAWDTHIRLGGAAGSNLEIQQCQPEPGKDVSNCMAAFMALHLTPRSSAYLEGMWVWTADHELDQDGVTQLNIFSGRGILSESQGPVWLIGTASEHHVLYQYQFVNARNHYIGLMQTETPYFQPYAATFPYPFSLSPKYSDPVVPPAIQQAWGALVRSSSDIFVFGAGLYSFFSNYSQARLATRDCQMHILDVDSDSRSVEVFSLATVSSRFQISMDGMGVVQEEDNSATGFASTVTRWSS